jgi:chromosomal replication initiator protein
MEMHIEEGNNVCIYVPNSFFADFIEENFRQVIVEAFTHCWAAPATVSFIPKEKDWHIIGSIQESMEEAKKRPAARKNARSESFRSDFTFDNYVVGDNNRMAYAAATAVAEAPGITTFNPLTIYGQTGIGKTHLLQAIGDYAQKNATASCVVYMSSQEFINQYIEYVAKKGHSTSFYQRFMKADLLLIDDIHFFGGSKPKPGIQKQFFNIFNNLLLHNNQIVLSSDRPPETIPGLMQHIISRFKGGLIADIQPPNFETRMAILRKKAENDGILLEDEVIEYLATHFTANVRELEGILIKLLASSSFTGRDITLEVAKEVCGDMMSADEALVTIDSIQQMVAHTFDISSAQLTAHTRKRNITVPRYIAMYLCKNGTKNSLRTIGLRFGGRDYSTVIHACKKVEELMHTDAHVAEIVATLQRRIESE